MGRRGPAPTPTPLLTLRGSTLVTQRRLRGEVKPPPGAPPCPEWLDAESKAAWRQLVPTLELMGILTKVDANALARYCKLWARWRSMEDFIDAKGVMYPLKGDDGKVKCFQQWPQVAIANKLAQQLTRLEAEFGMTPSARARIQVAPSQPEADRGKSRFFESA